MKPNKMFISIRLAILSLMLIAVVPAVGLAATFTVNSTTDAVVAVATAVNPVCETAAGNGVCTLRAAIQLANVPGAGPTTINLPAGNYALTIPGAGENAALTGDLDITSLSPVTIIGAGAATTIIDGNNTDRIFDIIGATTVSISGVTLRNGNSAAVAGGCINMGGAGRVLHLDSVVITGNKANAGVGGAAITIGGGGAQVTMNNVAVTNNIPPAPGGGSIIDVGRPPTTLTMTNSTISGNGDNGISNQGTTTLTNVTISGNFAVNAAGIDNKAGGTVSLQNCTINGNIATAVAGIGGIRNAGTVTVKNTIITNNTTTNCSGAITSLGNNLSNVAGCGLTAAGDVIAAPLLGPLANNTGAVQTHAILLGSPAIDTGAAAGCPATDARGVARPVDGNIPLDGVATCDMGAFEFRPQKLTVTLPPPFDFGTVTSATTSDHTITLTNAGDGPLIIGTIAAADPLAAPFSKLVDNCSGLTLALGGSCTVTARFAPTAAVTSPDSFDIPSNDPVTPSVTFALTGTGTALPVPIITVTDSVAPANDLSVPFGSIQVGATKDETVTITNDGTANLVIGTIASANPLATPFSITVDSCSGQTIAPAAACSLTVHFAPTDNSARTDSFDIPTNEADKPTVTVSLSGAGIAISATGTPVPGSTITVPGNNPPVIPVLVTPANGQAGLPTTVLLSWNRSSDPDGDALTYQVVNCVNQDFSGCTAVDVPTPTAKAQKEGLGGLGTGMILFGVVAGGCSRRSRKALLVVVAMLLSGTLMVACSGGSATAPASATGEMKFTVTGLTANTTYFWKVIVNDGKGGQATSEVRNYKTQ